MSTIIDPADVGFSEPGFYWAVWDNFPIDHFIIYMFDPVKFKMIGSHDLYETTSAKITIVSNKLVFNPEELKPVPPEINRQIRKVII